MGKTARNRRTWDRAKANGFRNDSKASQRYGRWVKSFQNVRAYDEYGFTYLAHSRAALIKNGGKP